MVGQTRLILTIVGLALAATPATAQDGTGDVAGLGAGARTSVALEDIFDDPGSVDKNVAYALQLIDEGRTASAASALERVLLLQPDLERVRLLYAIVLYRLGNLREAQLEFESVPRDTLEPRLRSLVDDYQARINRRLAKWSGSATIGAGVKYDSNRNAYPDSGDFTVLGNRIEGLDDEQEDFGLFALGSGQINYDPGLQRTDQIYLRGSLFGQDQQQEHRLDLAAAALEAGTVYYGDFVTVRPRLRYRHIQLGGSPYLNDVSAGARVEHQVKGQPQLTFFAAGDLGYEAFNDSDNFPFAEEQDGTIFVGKLGAEALVTPRFRLDMAYTGTNKRADVDFEAYDAHEFGIAGTYAFPNQSFLRLETSVEFQNFDAADPFINAGVERRDVEKRISLTYGIELASLLPSDSTVAPYLENTLAAATIGFTDQDSNIRNYDYQNVSGRLIVTRSFNF